MSGSIGRIATDPRTSPRPSNSATRLGPPGRAACASQSPSRSELDDLIRRAEAREAKLAASATRRGAPLPLRYWRQDAHFTTPASDETMARKAVEKGTEPVGRMMDRLGVT